MIFILYVVIAVFLMGFLSLKVINLRRLHKISIGDGGNRQLQLAISAQMNAVEYLPIGLILLLSLEINSGNILLIHVTGLTLLMGRFMHARGMFTDSMKMRVVGMHFTLYTLITLAILNLVYLPYGKLFHF